MSTETSPAADPSCPPESALAPSSPGGTPSFAAAAAAVTLVLWASAFVAIRHLGTDVPPGSLSLGRLVVAALALGVLLGIRRVRTRRAPRWPERRHLGLVLLCGVAWFGIYNVALNAAEQRIDAGTAALVVQIGPIIVALLAAVFLDEPLHRWLVVGLGIGFAGVVVIGRASSGAEHGDLLGVLMAVVAALTYAVGVLSQKPLLARAGALEVTFVATVVGAAVCLPWSGELVGVVRDSSPSTLLWIGYLGLFPTAIAFSTWAYALARTNASTMALSTFLVPFLAAGIAWVALSEVPPPLAFVGGALCIVGVLVSRRRPRARA
ncbi:DMT family transporter [Nocardioides zeae]|uniref:DMT family transporter n=1 Tax=Nocardioides imazamoxiresistens TaxID=3231893 RepID=A0ABU3PYC3_9ACTN|nr:DMT family transporter [Nocardioides zeae]MDT9594154.1 DMT family transporter [Nocardioides zeae]